VKLSEAIRAGAKLHPQGFEDFFTYDEETKELHTCSLGAAVEFVSKERGYEGDGSLWIDQILKDEWGDILFNCYLDDDIGEEIEEDSEVYDGIVHRNDKDRMTREQIADWVEVLGY
jgi:hypothetical protein